MNQETQKSKRIFGLDLVRALAISMIIVSGVYYLLDHPNPFFVTLSSILGFAGIELFFVLSGFLIGGIVLKLYLSDTFSFSSILNFLKRRWRRTLPNYYVLVILNLLIGIGLDYSLSNAWRYFLFLQNFTTYHITFFSESWSLSVIEWFYLIVPLVFFISHKSIKNKKWGYLITSFALIFLFHSIRYWLYENHQISDMKQWEEQVKSVVLYRMDTVLYGFILAWMHYFYSEILKKIRVYLFILALHLFFLQFVAMNVIGFDLISSQQYFLVYYFTLSSVTFLLVLPVFIYMKTAKGLFLRGVAWVSKLSYSIYLVYYGVVIVLMRVIKENYWQNIPLYLLVFIYLFFVFFCSFLLYRFVEKPMINKR